MEKKPLSQNNPFGSRYNDTHVSKIQLPAGECEKICRWLTFDLNPRMLTIIGNPGLGKTYICASAWNFLIEKGINPYSIRAFSEKQFFAILHKTIENDWDYLTEVERIADAPYLIIDDILTKDNPTEWQKEVLFHLIDLRYSNEKPTLLTSNVWLEDMKKIMGERFVSRLKDKGNTVMEINWIDKRQEKDE